MSAGQEQTKREARERERQENEKTAVASWKDKVLRVLSDSLEATFFLNDPWPGDYVQAAREIKPGQYTGITLKPDTLIKIEHVVYGVLCDPRNDHVLMGAVIHDWQQHQYPSCHILLTSASLKPENDVRFGKVV